MSPGTPDCCCIGPLKCSSRRTPPRGSWTSTRSRHAARTDRLPTKPSSVATAGAVGSEGMVVWPVGTEGAVGRVIVGLQSRS
eukprot:scaffold43832_cov54-Phaeocystis_antarctica.AAC.1